MNLEPQWVVGFVDGEGGFHVAINQHPEIQLGFKVLPEFTVVQHESDAQVLHALKTYFKCGVVRRNHRNRMAFRVRSVAHLADRVIPFFEKHHLKTRKRVEFLKFRRVVLLMQRGEHLTAEGLERIRRIAAAMNRGQSR